MLCKNTPFIPSKVASFCSAAEITTCTKRAEWCFTPDTVSLLCWMLWFNSELSAAALCLVQHHKFSLLFIFFMSFSTLILFINNTFSVSVECCTPELLLLMLWKVGAAVALQQFTQRCWLTSKTFSDVIAAKWRISWNRCSWSYFCLSSRGFVHSVPVCRREGLGDGSIRSQSGQTLLSLSLT